MKLKHIIFIAFVLSFSMFTFSQSHYPGQQDKKLKIRETVPMKAYAFPLSDIRLLDSHFTDNMKRESKWILSLGVDRLLHSFRTNAGVYAGLEGGYDSVDKLAGWESLDCELRGHTTGHILSGLALLYASTGDSVYKLKADSLVTGLSEVQEALNQGGYLSAFPQNLIDRNIDGQRVWAPWYTLHKLLAGLIDQYLYCNNQKSLEIAENMGVWAYDKLSQISKEQREVMLRNEFGGINDSFYTLYEITGNQEYKWLGEFFYHEKILEPLISQEDNLSGMHANTYIPKLIGVVRNYEIGGPQKERIEAEFFWNTVVDHHSYITGSNSDREKFFDADQTSKHLTGYTGESCNVYNMLKLTRHLFCLNANVKQADYYERTLYNHILGQQDPATGMIAYYLPMLLGSHKVYSTPDSSFWCCVGTGFENQAKYGEAIYYHKENTLFVNLFIPSVLNWEEQGVQIQQETKFPVEGRSTLTISIDLPKELTLNLRYPSWANSGASIRVNGKKIKVRQQPGSYITISRKWKNNDRIEIEYPMTLKVSPTPDNPDVVSIEYGPIVLAAEMGNENMQKPAPYSNPNLHNDYYTYDYHVPVNLSNVLSVKDKPIDRWLMPVEGNPLTFKVIDANNNKEYTLIPLFNLHRQRYVVYWYLE